MASAEDLLSVFETASGRSLAAFIVVAADEEN
jgi:hypothetical protein